MRHKRLNFFANAFLLATLSTSSLAQTRNIEWVELLPDEEREALLSAPPLNHEGGDTGPPPAPVLRSTNEAFGGDAFSQAMISANVRPELNGENVRLPGFVVPIEYDENQNVTEFFLVPYFGACIHMPPPPPNQIIYVAFPEGLELPSIYEPYTVEGQLTTSTTSNDLALSAYRIDAVTVTIYRE
ncbi:MAG: DUF3299 domain-containing protein [Pseudomonadota bacterium]|nr:DUF3299 domain-containing protein [Pseudomonadota bacterium]